MTCFKCIFVRDGTSPQVSTVLEPKMFITTTNLPGLTDSRESKGPRQEREKCKKRNWDLWGSNSRPLDNSTVKADHTFVWDQRASQLRQNPYLLVVEVDCRQRSLWQRIDQESQFVNKEELGVDFRTAPTVIYTFLNRLRIEKVQGLLSIFFGINAYATFLRSSLTS